MNNKYVNRSKISEAKFRKLVKLFSLDLTAKQISELTDLNRNTVNRYLSGIRMRIAEHCNKIDPHSSKNNRPIEKKIEDHTVIGLTENLQKIFISIPDQSLILRIKGVQEPVNEHLKKLNSGKIYYDVFFDIDSEWYFSMRKFKNESDSSFRKKYRRIDGFIGFLKNRIAKFRGMRKSTLYLHLKETEFRYNYKDMDIYYLLLKILRNNPLF